VRDVKVGGEIGRRIDVTINNNLLSSTPARTHQAVPREEVEDGYIGWAKLILSAVAFAAYSNNQEVRAFKDDLVARTSRRRRATDTSES